MKTGFKSNVKGASGGDAGRTPAPSREGGHGGVKADLYAAASPNRYEGLIKGHPKAPAGTIGKAARLREDPIQALIGDLMMGDDSPGAPSASDFELPYVPEFQGDIIRKAGDIDMAGVVERYAALEKTYVALLEQTEGSLDPSRATQFTASELRSLMDHREDLELGLFNVRRQLGKARYYAVWQEKAGEEAARKLDEDLP